MLLKVFLFAAVCACAVNANITNKRVRFGRCLCVDGNRVNARVQPGGTVKAKLNRGQCYKFVGGQRRKGSYRWFRISVDRRRLWVAGTLLKFGRPSQCAPSRSVSCGDAVTKGFACKLINLHSQGRIVLWKKHPSGVRDNAYAYNNIYDTCQGKGASRSSYKCNDDCNAPGGQVCLDRRVVKYLFNLAKKGWMHVNEVAGACHSCKSRHFRGLAVDLHKDKRASEYMDLCEKMNGWALDEGRHIHCQFR